MSVGQGRGVGVPDLALALPLDGLVSGMLVEGPGACWLLRRGRGGALGCWMSRVNWVKVRVQVREK
jgi:hypothetical protein